MNDLELAYKVKSSDDEEALNELMNRHEAMFYNVVHKYSNAFQESGVYKPDVLEDKSYIFYKTAKSFNPEKKAKFSTWLGNYTRYECLNRITGNYKYLSTSSDDIESILNSKFNIHKLPTNIIEECLDIVNNLNDKRAIEVFKLRYFSESRKPLTWKQIGKKLKISTQTALNVHNRTIDFLKKNLKTS